MKITLSKLEASIILRNYFVDKIGLNPFDNDLDVEVVESLTFEREVQEYGESLPKINTYRGEEITEEEKSRLEFFKNNNNDLYNFLEEKYILLEYVRNTINAGRDVYGMLSIGNAFTWSNTDQGYDYWSDLEDEFDSL